MHHPTAALHSRAEYDPTGTHRFWLERHLPQGSGIVHFNLCNPSTATEHVNDATVYKCEQYATLWGYRTYLITNAYSYRARDFTRLFAVPTPSLPANDGFILLACQAAALTVCGWSEHATYRDRHLELAALLAAIPLTALRVNRSGLPAHPVYLPADAEPQRYTPRLISL